MVMVDLKRSGESIFECRGPIWQGQDLSPCIRQNVLNFLLPLLLLALSLVVLILQSSFSNRRRAKTVSRVAQLDPSSSNIHFDNDEVDRNGTFHQGAQSYGILSRVLTAIMPLNGSRLASRLRSGSSSRHRQRRHEPQVATLESPALAVFRTENAVILNEVQRVLRESTLEIEGNNEGIVSRVGLERLKRVWETIGSLVGVALSFTGTLHGHANSAWMIFWIYMALVSLATLSRSTSFFKHKAFLFGFAFLAALWNLRSSLINPNENRFGFMFALIYTTNSALTFLPSVVFPYQSRIPMRLRAIMETIHPEPLHGEAPTAIPTPRRRSSPTTSFSEDAGALEAADQAREYTRLIPSKENHASVLSRALFGFVTPTIVKHYREQFTLEAVPNLPLENHAAEVVAAYRSESEKAKGSTKSSSKARRSHYDEGEDSDDEEDAPLLNEDLGPGEERLGFKESSLRWRLARHFAPLLLLQLLWASIEAVASLSAPLGIRLILGFIADRARGDKQTPMHMAFLYCAVLLVGGLTFATCASQALMTGRRICVRARAILIFEIVNKALRRRDTGGAIADETEAKDSKSKKADDESGKKEAAKERTSDGEVTNLVAVDVFRVSEIGAYLHFIFPSSPIEILLCTVFLIKILGASAVAGLATIVIAIPLQTYSAKLFTKMQQKLLKAVDQRLNLASEVLNCIKTVKFFAWEEPFKKRMNETREKELTALKHRFYAFIFNYCLYLSIPTLVTLITFTVHTIVLKKPLPAETAFTALALFNALRKPLEALPDMYVNVLSAFVSLRRIDKFLSEDETTKYEQLMPNGSASLAAAATSSQSSTNLIGFSRATFTFSENDEEIESGTVFCLKNLSIDFPRGELSIIAGPVGSGKTTLLLSLLGETRRLTGQTFMPCAVARTLLPIDRATGLSESIAYCPQSPWLLGATVKENILFGQPYEEHRYRAVIKACALEPDLDILEYNDETDVGEKGTALSGGQKARVALARAIYSPARYLLLDDVLSAVDAHTAKHLYRHCLKGSLVKGRTVILVTHAVALCLPGAKLAVALQDGNVIASGSPGEVRASGVFDNDIVPSTTASPGTQTPNGNQSKDAEENKGDLDDEEDPQITVEELSGEAKASKLAEMKAKREKKALHANIETYGKGNVGFKAYKLYVCSFAATTIGLVSFWAVYVFFFASSRITDVVNAAWLRQWASTYDTGRRDFNGSGHEQEDERDQRTRFYLGVYGILALVYVMCSIGRDSVAVVGSLRASRLIYQRLLGTILHARPQWFDRTPIGRIMNRLSKDIETIDQDVTLTLIFFIDVCLQSIVIVAVACYSLPIFTLFAIVISLLYWAIGALYIVSSRDLKRIESVTRSPIFTLVGEVLSGAVVIRAYGDASRFTRHCLRLIDKTNRAFYFLWCENRWLSIRVDYLATITSFSVAIFLVLSKDIDAALAGFTLSFTVQLVDAVLWVMRMYTQLEINANSVERVDEYLALEGEAFGKGSVPPADWPSKQGGAIEVRNLCVRYAPELPLVLKDVSFTVQAGEKIGICGRTGSGKSSLALAFFRFLEAESGNITVDGLDLSEVELSFIRSRLTIIPQEAQLFSGSIRFNLDPFNVYDDAVLWDVLQRCKIAASPLEPPKPSAADASTSTEQGTAGAQSDAVEAEETRTNIITSLDMPVEQGGKNFSAGQRQLIALARGLLKLRASNIVILDESTASLDAGSDAAVQRTIRSEMQDATMLVVAHRIRGIVSFDKVLVLDAGKVVEFDRPSTLIRKEGGAFRQLCQRSGEFDLLMQLADEADSERAVAAVTRG